MKVLAIGEVVLDRVHLLEHFPGEGEKVNPNKIKASLGGPVVGGVILLSKLGADCRLIGKVGEDQDGALVKRKLDKYNIQFIPRFHLHTKVNTILVNKKTGSRTIVKDKIMHEPITNIPRDIIQQADLIVLDRHEPEAFEEVIRKRRKDTKIVIDPSTEVSQKTIRMCQHADVPIIPIESLKKFRRDKNYLSNLQEAYKVIGKTLIVTLGEYGSLIFDGKKIERVPAISIKPVDTLGAGDIFRGAFGFGLMKQWSLRECVEFANLVAAMQCMGMGNEAAIPNKRDIEVFQKTAKPKQVSFSKIFHYED